MKKLWILLALMLSVAFIAIGVGSTYITPSELIAALTDRNASSWFIVHHYRSPRGLLAIMAGAGLAVAGVLLQGMIRNPLASPDVVGVSKGAGFAAVLVIVLLPSSPVALLPVAAFVGAGLAALLLVQLSMKGGMRPNMLALTGLAVGAIFQAATDYILVKYPLEASDTLTWLAGSLWGKGWDEVYGLLPWLIVLLPLAYALQRKLDIMSLDEESSAGLGLSVKRVRTGLLAVSVALVRLLCQRHRLHRIYRTAGTASGTTVIWQSPPLSIARLGDDRRADSRPLRRARTGSEAAARNSRWHRDSRHWRAIFFVSITTGTQTERRRIG